MTEAEIAAYLKTQTILNIASIGPTGHPHLVAMWYEVMDGKVTFWTFGKSQKIVNLRRNNKITGLIESGDAYEELKGLEIVGTATIIEDYDKILAIGKAVGLKYNGEGAISDAALPFLEAQAKKRLGIQIEVENIVSWDHSKIGGGYYFTLFGDSFSVDRVCRFLKSLLLTQLLVRSLQDQMLLLIGQRSVASNLDECSLRMAFRVLHQFLEQPMS